jgi:hypothetical protein
MFGAVTACGCFCRRHVASAKADLASLPEYKNLLLVAQKQLLELPLNLTAGTFYAAAFLTMFYCLLV